MTTNIAERVKEIVAEHLGISSAADIKEDATFADLGADSLDTVELVMALEEEFDQEIPDEEAEKLVTVKDVINYIQARADAK